MPNRIADGYDQEIKDIEAEIQSIEDQLKTLADVAVCCGVNANSSLGRLGLNLHAQRWRQVRCACRKILGFAGRQSSLLYVQKRARAACEIRSNWRRRVNNEREDSYVLMAVQ